MPESARAVTAQLHPVERRHLDALTDGTGIMQHAIGTRPDPAHGYCTDDVARALQVDLLHGRALGWADVAVSAGRCLRFLEEAFDPATGRFRNFRAVDGSWLDGEASEDSNGRAMLALGEAMAAADPAAAAAARSLFERALPATRRSVALRARASVLLGCDAAIGVAPTASTVEAHRILADELLATFTLRGSTGWPWPERRLTYENALPVRALIVAGRRLGSRPMVDAGLAGLDWLIAVQTATDGHLSPVGNGWWAKGGERSVYDQQPIEATALLLAAEAALAATGFERYGASMEQAYGWFLGANDLGVDIADPTRGAGCDGLTPHGANTNQGAESTLMWLTALEHIRVLRAARAERLAGLPTTAGRAPRPTTHQLIGSAG